MSQHLSDTTIRNPGNNVPFSAILQTRMSRRTVMRGGVASALTLFAGAGSARSATPAAGLSLGFESLPASMTDTCIVPPGYTATVLGAWGEPLNDQAAPWRSDGSNSAHDLLHSTGMHHDGMHYFSLNGSSTEGLLAVNHEYIDEKALHPNGPTGMDGKRPAEEVSKEINAHGVSVMHIRKQGADWHIVQNSRYNRRFTSATPMILAGPVAGTD